MDRRWIAVESLVALDLLHHSDWVLGFEKVETLVLNV